MDPTMIQQMLTQQLQQVPQASSFGGGSGGPQMQGRISPMDGAAQLVQKVMLMRALQNMPQTPGGATGQQQRQATAGVAPTNAAAPGAVAANPQIQAMQQGMQQPMPLNLNVPPMTPPDPSLMPTPGYS
jgi:hypothetical protein